MTNEGNVLVEITSLFVMYALCRPIAARIQNILMVALDVKVYMSVISVGNKGVEMLLM